MGEKGGWSRFQRKAAPGSYTWMDRIWEFMNHKGVNVETAFEVLLKDTFAIRDSNTPNSFIGLSEEFFLITNGL
jgi:hypothetical protein